jgi:hypothetical protein
MELKIEANSKAVEAQPVFEGGGSIVMVTPAIDEDYWTYRVPLSAKQAIVCFPKFGIIGCGFQVEDDDWNTNLPLGCPAKQIFNHIKRNKGDDSISDADCIKAIEMLQDHLKPRRA